MRVAKILTTALLSIVSTIAYADSIYVDPISYGLSKEYGNKIIVYCKDIGGGRKRVWINTSQGTFALNGPAIQWTQDAIAMGTPIIGSDGNPIKLGRDHLPISVVHDLIKVGLKQC